MSLFSLKTLTHIRFNHLVVSHLVTPSSPNHPLPKLYLFGLNPDQIYEGYLSVLKSSTLACFCYKLKHFFIFFQVFLIHDVSSEWSSFKVGEANPSVLFRMILWAGGVLAAASYRGRGRLGSVWARILILTPIHMSSLTVYVKSPSPTVE